MLHISESSTAVEMIQKHLLRKSLSTYLLPGLFINQGSQRRLFLITFYLIPTGWFIPVILVLGRQISCEFKANLVSVGSSRLARGIQ